MKALTNSIQTYFELGAKIKMQELATLAVKASS